MNHAGDMLTGNLTMKQVKKLGLNVIKVVTQEDIANAPRSNADDRRGFIGKLGVETTSFAALLASEKFKAENIDAEYVNFEIPRIEDFMEVIEENPNLCGLKVRPVYPVLLW